MTGKLRWLTIFLVAFLLGQMPGALAMISYDDFFSNLSNYFSGYYNFKINGNGQVAIYNSKINNYGLYLYKGNGAPLKIWGNLVDSFQINDKGWVAWKKGNALFLYKGQGEPIQVTSGKEWLGRFIMNNNGWIAWEGDYDIYLYKGDGTPIRLTNNNYYDILISINDNNYILYQNKIWKNYGYYYDLFLFNGKNNSIRITNNDVQEYNPQLGPNNWVVWQELQKYHYDYFLYKGSGDPIRLTDNNARESNLHILPNGWVVWEGFDGKDNEIYLYKGSGNPINFTNNVSSDRGLAVNPNGWMVWQGSDGRDDEIYLYRGAGQPLKLTDNNYNDRYPQINKLGLVVWEAFQNNGRQLYLFWHGVTQKLTDNVKAGTVRLLANQPKIYWQDTSDRHYLATVSYSVPYSFKYTYGNGDFYTGTVYAATRRGYFPGKSWTTKDENGLTGRYTIIDAGNAADSYASRLGQVYVDSYYDAESRQQYIPVSTGKAVGTGYLGTEQDYLLKAGVAAYRFGKGYYEADVGDQYLFRYTFGNGDFYRGLVYQAPAADGYYPGQKITKKNELGLDGYYEILAASWTGDTSKYGQVFVDLYRDGESQKNYAPVSKGKAVGSSYLGSELDYILRAGVEMYKFGQGYYEADVADRFTYRYTYGNGDFYTGYFYASPNSTYYPGWKLTKANELGKVGSYEILAMQYTGATDKYGQIYVTRYYDGDMSKKSYQPVNYLQPLGTRLGTEQGYIIALDNAAYYFGMGYYEADGS